MKSIKTIDKVFGKRALPRDMVDVDPHARIGENEAQLLRCHGYQQHFYNT